MRSYRRDVGSLPALLLKPGREKSLLRRHPWIFSGAVAEVQGSPGEGETVDVLDSKGSFLARAAYSPHSQIRARVWTWDPLVQVDADFFRARLIQALSGRKGLLDQWQTSALRLVHGESDNLPGVIVDQYAQTIVVQLLTAGADAWREVIADLLLTLTGVESIFERSDADVRQLEGLAPRIGLLRGVEPPQWLQIEESGLHFWVDLRQGHKTGFYLDQRDNRRYVRQLAEGRDVLDCFSYTGGFALACLAGGAESVLAVDASQEALDLAKENLTLNGFPSERVEWLQGDVFQVLRTFRDRGLNFDLVVLDPPKFAATASQVERAARGYKDINLLAFKLLRPGGFLVTFSCSGGVSEDLFQKILAGAALDAGVDAQIVARLYQGADHPVALNFPEGAYLKGFVLRIPD